MKKVIFFTTAVLFFTHTQGMQEGHVAKLTEFYEEIGRRSSTPENKVRKSSDKPMSEQEHLAATFPKGHPSKELSNDSLRELFLVLYPGFVKNKQS